MLASFNELVAATETIPQLKQQNSRLSCHQYKNGSNALSL